MQVRDVQERLLAVGTLVDADTGGAQIEIDTALGQGQQVVVTVLGPRRTRALPGRGALG